MSTATNIQHIMMDDAGTAYIDDTNVKVVEVVADKLAHGSSPEEMHLQYPHLSLAQIYAALAYYHDHKSEIDEQIQRNHEECLRLKAHAPETPGRQKLRVQGIRP